MRNLLELCKESAELVPNVMKDAESEWTPVLMYEDGAGVYHTAGLMGMTPHNLPSTAQEVEDVLRSSRAKQAALLLPTWFRTEPDGVPVERVLITFVDRVDTTCEAAKVIRSETEKPRLGRWDVYVRDSDVSRGLFVDAMRAAIG